MNAPDDLSHPDAAHLDSDELTRLLRLATGFADLEVTAFDSRLLTSGRSGAAVYRVQASARQGDASVDASLVCKVGTTVRRFGVDHDVDDPIWQREALLAEAGLLRDAAPGLRPARVIDVLRPAPDRFVLWTEDAGQAWAGDWDIARFGDAAFHLGQFHARFADAHPAHDWLGRGQWRAYVRDHGAAEDLRRHGDHPAVQSVYPPALQQRLFALHDDADALIAEALDGAVIGLAHGDPSGRNLLDVDGETVAIDWDEVGLAPLGEDPARMVGSSLHWFFLGRMDAATDLAETCLARYLDGLRVGGSTVDQASVERVFRTALATIYGLSYLGIANGIVENRIDDRARNAYHTTVPQLLEHMGIIAAFCAEQADRARTLSR